MFFEQQASHAGSSEDFRPLLNYSSSLFCGCPQVPVLCGHAASLMRGHTARVFSLLHSSRVLFCGIPQQPVPFLSVLSLATCGHTAIDAAVAKRPQFPCGRNRNFAAAPCRKLFCDGHSACMCGHPQVAQSTFCAVNRKLLLFLAHAVHGMRGSMCCFLFRSLFVGCVLLRSLFVCLFVCNKQQTLLLLRDVEASCR